MPRWGDQSRARHDQVRERPAFSPVSISPVWPGWREQHQKHAQTTTPTPCNRLWSVSRWRSQCACCVYRQDHLRTTNNRRPGVAVQPRSWAPFVGCSTPKIFLGRLHTMAAALDHLPEFHQTWEGGSIACSTNNNRSSTQPIPRRYPLRLRASQWTPLPGVSERS